MIPTDPISEIPRLLQASVAEGTGWSCFLDMHIIIEQTHDETNKINCAHSKDSDQPGHPPSMISCELDG